MSDASERTGKAWEQAGREMILRLDGTHIASVSYSEEHGWDAYIAVLSAYSPWGPFGHDDAGRVRAMRTAEVTAEAWRRAAAQTSDLMEIAALVQEEMMSRAYGHRRD